MFYSLWPNILKEIPFAEISAIIPCINYLFLGYTFKIKTVNTMNYFVIFHPQNQILGLIFICSSRAAIRENN